jgi:hypothetical protein
LKKDRVEWKERGLEDEAANTDLVEGLIERSSQVDAAIDLASRACIH